MTTGVFRKGEMLFTLPDRTLLSTALYRLRAPKIRLKGGEATVELFLEADVLSPVPVSTDGEELRRFLEAQLETELSGVCAALQRANSDAMGFGRFRAKQFRRVSDWENCDWKAEYRALSVRFCVTVMLSHNPRETETE